MTAPTTPSPERQPADAGGGLLPCPFDGYDAELRQAHDEFSRKRSVVVCRGCGATTDPCIGDNRAIAAWNRRTGAPQAQPDARAVEARKKLQSWLDDFDRENADDIDNDDFNIGQDELIEVPTEDLRRVLQALSAPAADDGWRPSREEVVAAMEEHVSAEIVGTREDRAEVVGIQAAADAILALHPAAPTDEVGKS